jgi:hypothetical protein
MEVDAMLTNKIYLESQRSKNYYIVFCARSLSETISPRFLKEQEMIT